MMKTLLCTLGLALSVSAFAQTVTVTATHLGGTTPISGTITFQPTLADGKTQANARLSGGLGITSRQALTATVTAGVFTLPNVTDTNLSNPQNLCYAVTVRTTNGLQALGPGFTCVQPAANNTWCSSGVCNFDMYPPNLSPLAATVTGATGAQGPPGCVVGSACSAVLMTAPLASQASVQPRGTSLTLNNLVLDKVANVTAYGAYCDGVHDDHGAFAAAIAVGGKIKLPARSVCVSSAAILIAGSNLFTEMEGEGEGSAILFTGATDGIDFASTSNATAFCHCALRNLTVFSNNPGSLMGVSVVNTGLIDLENVKESGFGLDGFYANFAQYMQITNPSFSGNGRYGMNLDASVVPGSARGLLETNGISIQRGVFNSNGSWGTRIQAAFQIKCYDCTVQANAGGGSVDTGDNGGVVGGVVGTGSGVFANTIIWDNTHWEFNNNINYYAEQVQYSYVINPVFASPQATNGSYVVGANALNKWEHLIGPFFLSVTPLIKIMGGAYDVIETGDAAASDVTNLSSDSDVTNGSHHSSPIYAGQYDFQPGPGVVGNVGDASLADTLTVQRAGVTIKSNSTNYGVSIVPQGGTNPFTFVGSATAPRFIQLPDANTAFPILGTPSSSAATCTPPQVEFDGSFGYLCVAPNTWRKFSVATF